MTQAKSKPKLQWRRVIAVESSCQVEEVIDKVASRPAALL
jgi:hypothetical protein